MTYVVTDACIRCKYMDCVPVCPANCFYEGENMVVINPDECIDCSLCEDECPANAILPGDEADEQWLELNAKYSALWPQAVDRRPPADDADSFKGVSDKFQQYFSPAPGKGG